MELNNHSNGNGERGDSDIDRIRGSELQEITVESPQKPDVVAVADTKFYSGIGKNGAGSPSKSVLKTGGRKWKYFPGKNRFFCNGLLITAPNISFCICCFFLIVITFTLFLIFDGPYLVKRWSWAVPVIAICLFVIVIVSMLSTTFSDPGIIPRASQQEAEYIERSYNTNNIGRPPPRTKDIIVNGQTVKVKYCVTCKMFRPPRASHCGVCDNCVDRFDHHCPFLGNCIGKRNYRHFYTFVLSLSLLCVFVLSCSIAHLVLVSREKGNFLEALKDSPTSAVVMIISFFGMWTVLSLAGFHTYLISVEQTTNEDIKGTFGRNATKNPYSRGNIFQNCSFVLCGPVAPSLIDSRGLVTDDFLASLIRKHEANGATTSTMCNRNTLHLQTSIKTGPQCVENPQRLEVKPQSPYQEPQSSIQTLETGATTSSILHSNTVPSSQPLSPHHPSPDSERALLTMSASSTRSLADTNSESMKNLYNAAEDDEHLVSPGSDSGSESLNPHNSFHEGRYNVSSHEDDFDDPTVIDLSPDSGITSPQSLQNQELGIDIDDPIAAHHGPRSPQLSKANVRRKKTPGRQSASLASLPSMPSSTRAGGINRSLKNKASKSQATLEGLEKPVQLPSSNLNSSATSNGHRVSGKKTNKTNSNQLSKSTMIDSPLHLDPVI